ncbi:MAG: hypothetical protein J0I06_03365 [Planctomycetes bacterium]|nr:hypothetical protein [Planctomycetota bacterium]
MAVSFRRVGKYAALIALAAGVLTGAARIGISRFLSSSRGKAMVADRLGAALGMPVEVSEIDVGDANSSFRFRVMDPADPKAEVLNVPAASADVSAADLVTGRVAPSALKLANPSLTLRVGRQGQVRTPLPSLPATTGPIPAVVIEGGQIRVRQDGRPDFAVSGISLKLEPVGPAVVLSGTIDDPKWGRWTARGEVRRDARAGWVELTSPDAPLDAELLATIPFVPASLFDDLPDGGRAAVTVRLEIGPDREIVPTVEVRQTRRIFGIPSESTIRITPGSEHPNYDPLR